MLKTIKLSCNIYGHKSNEGSPLGIRPVVSTSKMRMRLDIFVIKDKVYEYVKLCIANNIKKYSIF
jgi:hypothetical protein